MPLKPVKDFIIRGDERIEVTYKSMKSIRLKFNQKLGEFKVSAPLFLSKNQVVEFLDSKQDWILKNRALFNQQPKIIPHSFKSGELHWFLGKQYCLEIREVKGNYGCSIVNHSTLVLLAPIGSSLEERKAILVDFNRQNMKVILPQIISKWERIIGVKSSGFLVRKMKTRWGTCNTSSKRITLNLELIKHPYINLEHVVVHELVHLLERGHTKRFYDFLTQFQPGWQLIDADIKKRGLEC